MLLLGVLQAQAAGAVAAGSFDLLETQVLASSAASVTFSSLSTYAADYQHLQIRAVVSQDSGGDANISFRFNADTGNNYNYHHLFGTGSSVLSGNSVSDGTFNRGFAGNQGNDATAFSATVIDILDPFETTKFTTTRALTGNRSSQIWLVSSLWRNTNALTSMVLFPQPSGSFRANSRFSLYGIKAGS